MLHCCLVVEVHASIALIADARRYNSPYLYDSILSRGQATSCAVAVFLKHNM